ncbi:MAG TPA: hypothetical protein VFV10_09060 [Gammaproteobacteria bacterium]|nr:hypothetical protein [Gammaproteobacteria bacterium]
MSLIKNELSAQLDDVTRVASETLELFADLAAGVEPPELARLLDRQSKTLRRLVDEISEHRRRRGELPEAGDPERAHLRAAAARLRASVLPGRAAASYAESILDAAATLRAEIEEALAAGPDDRLRALLEDMKRETDDFEQDVRSLVPDARPR